MPLNIEVAWDFSDLVLEDIYVVGLSYGNGGGNILSAPPVSSPAIINEISVAIPPPLPTAGDITPAVSAVTATNTDSEAIYGTQSSPVVMSILAYTWAAEELAQYLGRAQPKYWYSNIRINIGDLSDANKTIIAQLELGAQIRVSKRFPGMASPVIQDLFVEGIEHQITPSSHTVTIYTSPGVLYADFLLNTSELDDAQYGLG
jgi:hypothetical protein